MKSLYRSGLSFQMCSPFLHIISSFPQNLSPRRRGAEARKNRKIISSRRWRSTLIGRIVLILFLSPPLFAQESAPQDQTKGHKNVAPVSETQIPIPKETTNPDSPYDPQIFAAILAEIQKGSWTENRLPGPVFNTCSTWEGAVKCYWAVFRMDNLTGRHQKEAYAIHNHLTAEGLEKELNYLKSSPDSLSPYSKAWFLLMAVEFFFWAGNKERRPKDEILKIFPMAHTLASELSSFIEDSFNNPLRKDMHMHRAGFVFILYAFYNYVSVVNPLGEEFAQPFQTLEDSIRIYFFHRNDGSQADQSAKAKACRLVKREGIHRGYLEEKGLLLPGYEEFEEQNTQEDIKRIKDCEKKYETITFSGKGPGEPKDIASSFYYAHVLLLLKISGGDEAVRYFIRHNPVFHKEFALPDALSDDTRSEYNTFLLLNHHITYSILKGLYNDPEWQMDWESIRNDHNEAFLEKNIFGFESAIFYFFAFSESFILNHKSVKKEGKDFKDFP